MNFKKQALRVCAVIAAAPVLVAPMAANAAFTLPTELTDSATNVALVGGAVFTIGIGIKLYKWLKSAL